MKEYFFAYNFCFYLSFHKIVYKLLNDYLMFSKFYMFNVTNTNFLLKTLTTKYEKPMTS